MDRQASIVSTAVLIRSILLGIRSAADNLKRAEFVQSPSPVLMAHARPFHATQGGVRIEFIVLVDPACSALQLRHELSTLFQVSGPDRPAQPELSGIGPLIASWVSV